MALLLLYGSTIFLSAWLLFTVQPLFGKMLLPLLGGAPAVWNSCMFFFQAALLAGYAYAHFTVVWLGVRRQAVLHLVVLAIAAVALPIAIPAGWAPPSEANPIPSVLLLLTVCVGLPFFAASTTSPLLQKWFAQTRHPSAHDPYFLYSASNLGSMVALLGYPLVVEPFLGLGAQGRWWTYGYVGFLLLAGASALALWRASAAAGANGPAEAGNGPSGEEGEADQVNGRRRLWWVMLAFVPSSWMLGVTTHLTTDITPGPLLWVIPLALYLLSFVLVFSRRPLIPHAWILSAVPAMILVVVIGVVFMGVWQTLIIHLIAFFFGAMVFHGQLARDRPSTRYLTEYYLWMAVGGMAGGLFNALIAPLVFPVVLEYPLTIAFACLIFPGRRSMDDPKRLRRIDLAVLSCVVLVVAALLRYLEPARSKALFAVVIASIPLLIGFHLTRKRHWFALVVAAVFLVDAFEDAIASKTIFAARSFFGVHQVTLSRDKQFHHLMHGTTRHGSQLLDPMRAGEPMSYYHSAGPMGHIFRALNEGDGPRRIAIVGLGTGASVCYRRPRDTFVFYEIDPLVKEIAENPELFTYLTDRGGDGYEIVLGDGRLGLAKAPDGSFSMIILDAFSSDAIPVHLLTREALQVYRSKLQEGGSIVFHVTNRYLDLELAVSALAHDAEMICVAGRNLDLTDEPRNLGRAKCRYMVLTKDKDYARALASHPDWEVVMTVGLLSPWTDDFSNILSVLKWK